MTTVTISPKFQIVLPLEIRKRMGLRPGQKIRAMEFDDRIELIPVRPIRSMRGFLRGRRMSISLRSTAFATL